MISYDEVTEGMVLNAGDYFEAGVASVDPYGGSGLVMLYDTGCVQWYINDDCEYEELI